MSNYTKNRLSNTRTSISNDAASKKMFQERRGLVGKWFDKWTDDERRAVLDDLTKKCKHKQIQYIRNLIEDRCPSAQRDYTSVLPRILSLYVFSFLDPRSLSRCSQVCWHWKNLTELATIWMPKCLRLGWYPPYTPSPYETGVWKRTYIEHIKSIQVLTPKESPVTAIERLKLDTDRSETRPPRPKRKVTPWKGSDPDPKDTMRYNILDNDDIIESVASLRRKGYYGKESGQISRNARCKVKTGSAKTNLVRSNSAPRLAPSSPESPVPAKQQVKFDTRNGRPQSAINTWSSSIHMNGHQTSGQSPAGKTKQRPASAQAHYTSVKMGPSGDKGQGHPSTARSARDPPTTPLFPAQPWNIPDDDMDDED